MIRTLITDAITGLLYSTTMSYIFSTYHNAASYPAYRSTHVMGRDDEYDSRQGWPVPCKAKRLYLLLYK